MTLLVSLTVAVIFGVAAYLMLKRDLIRVITGMILLGNAANLFIMSAGLREGGAPLVPSEEGRSDPLVQALTLTAIVISFGTATLVLALVYRVYDSHHSVDIARIGSEEERQAMLDDQPSQEDLAARMGSEDDPELEPEDDRRETADVVGARR
jgi:multicomponent Na+:H+ antiporter subunit C